jgi:AcrR family transcriptional regulator
VAITNDTSDRILDGALRALARHGLRKLSMSDIGEEAGVSRGTLYRYFRSKDEVLEAIGEHVSASFEAALDEAVRDVDDPTERLRAALHVVVHYNDTHPEGILVLEADPAFAIAFLRRRFSHFVDVLRDALAPVFAQSPAVRNGAVTERELAEILQRLAMSAFLLPSPLGNRIPEVIAGLWSRTGRAPAANDGSAPTGTKPSSISASN